MDGERSPKRIVIVGASAAGAAGAEELRRLGFAGEIVLVGAEGRLPYERPMLSKSVLMGQQSAEECALRPPAWHDDLGLELHLNAPAVGLDLRERAVELASGERVRFDGLIVATGANPRMLPGGGEPLAGVCTLRTLDDALALRAALSADAQVVVVGGGFIGAEVAATARSLGATVTIIEAEEAPLARSAGPAIGALLAQVHTDHGVDVRCGVPVAGFEGRGHVERVRLADSSAVSADVVVVGLGVTPATDWLRGSGLKLRDGVLCDACCRTSAPGVVAAGDVARWEHPRLGSIRIEHWENALEQGRAAAGALLGSGAAEPFAPVPYVWSDQYDYKIQFVGAPHPEDHLVVVDGELGDRHLLALYTRGEQVTAAVAFNRAGTIARIRRLLRGGEETVSGVIDALAAAASKRKPRETSAAS